jgi:hypothetical protein
LVAVNVPLMTTVARYNTNAARIQGSPGRRSEARCNATGTPVSTSAPKKLTMNHGVDDRFVDGLERGHEGAIVRPAQPRHDGVCVQAEDAGHQPHGDGGRKESSTAEIPMPPVAYAEAG